MGPMLNGHTGKVDGFSPRRPNRIVGKWSGITHMRPAQDKIATAACSGAVKPCHIVETDPGCRMPPGVYGIAPVALQQIGRLEGDTNIAGINRAECGCAGRIGTQPRRIDDLCTQAP